MAKGIFVTGTGTDVGKTYVTALIVKKLADAGIHAGYYKAALSGAESDCFYYMHIIICKILELVRNNRLFFQFPYFIDQTDQCLIDHLICVIHSHLL